MDLRICLGILLLCCNAIFVSSECPKYEEWQNKTISPGGPLVCALLYGDSQCVGFPLTFGINSSSPNLGSDSSPFINFYANNITALVRPGCKMYLWEGTNFTGHDPDLLKCEVHDQWKLRKFCDFRESDVGGSCSFTLEHSYIEEKSENETSVVTNVTITETMSDIFAEKMIESFGEQRMFYFLDANRSDTSTHTIIVDPRSAISVKQRSYVCGKYHLFTPEIARQLSEISSRDKWIYNPRYNTYYWFSSETQTYADAVIKCQQLGGYLTHIFETERYTLRKWLARFMIPSSKWWVSIETNISEGWDEDTGEWHRRPSIKCWVLEFISKNDGFGLEEYVSPNCNSVLNLNYICAKNLDI
ncbi:hypothetical protein DdX_17643 [Ditylenchus destructor]|uniref:C-type lectin domain-containing protein n=1 Tax=Ditylenchus destructor TaxID=166010 RepID=A0AAD4MQZ5_9BILA|nr:hypothetical protein DdX_17643 [Ditylenchus destructor]